MGQRELLVSGELFIEFLKAHDGMERTYTVDNALPDDARLVDFVFKANRQMAFVLESESWIGQSEVPLKQPAITIWYGEAGRKELEQRKTEV